MDKTCEYCGQVHLQPCNICVNVIRATFVATLNSRMGKRGTHTWGETHLSRGAPFSPNPSANLASVMKGVLCPCCILQVPSVLSCSNLSTNLQLQIHHPIPDLKAKHCTPTQGFAFGRPIATGRCIPLYFVPRKFHAQKSEHQAKLFICTRLGFPLTSLLPKEERGWMVCLQKPPTW